MAYPYDNPYTNYDFGDFFNPSPRRNRFNYLPTYGDEEAPSGSDTSGPDHGTDSFSASQYLKDIQDAYMRESRASSAYRAHMQQMPQNNPSGWRRAGGAITAGLLAYGGERPSQAMAAGTAATEGPYRQQMERWLHENQALKAQADIENRNLQTRTAFGRDMLTAERNASNEKLAEKRENRLQTSAEFKQRMDADRMFERSIMNDWRRKHGDEVFNLQKATQEFNEEKGREQLDQGWARVATGERNASTAARNAGTASRRADIYDWTSLDRSNQGWSRIENQGGTEDTYNPGSAMNQRRAGEDAAKKIVLTNPKWRKYIDDSGAIVPPTKKSGLMSSEPMSPSEDPEYKKFLDALEKEKKGILTKPGRRRRSPNVATPPFVGPQQPPSIGGLKF